VRTTRGQCTRPTFLASLQAASPPCAPRPRATYTRAEHPWPSSRFSVQCSPKQPVPRSHWSAAVAACGWWQSSAPGGLPRSIRLQSARRRRFAGRCQGRTTSFGSFSGSIAKSDERLHYRVHCRFAVAPALRATSKQAKKSIQHKYMYLNKRNRIPLKPTYIYYDLLRTNLLTSDSAFSLTTQSRSRVRRCRPAVRTGSSTLRSPGVTLCCQLDSALFFVNSVV
jgi:hypothetical protein